MNIAFVITSLSNKGPVIVVKDIVNNLPVEWDVTIYFFDDIHEVDFPLFVNLVKVDGFLSRVDLSSHDVVHSHLLRADVFCWFNRKSIKTHISTMHADIVKDLQLSHGYCIGTIVGGIWTRILKSADHIVFLTELQKVKYKQLKLNSVIYNGRPVFKGSILPDKDVCEIKSKYSNCTMLGACANIVKRKGFEQVVDFLSRVEGRDFLFVLVGDGPDLENIKTHACNMGVDSRCFFVGKTANVHSYLCLFDIFVMSSYSEGMPLSLLEAASDSVPIVCSDLPVIKEVFSSDEVAFYQVGNIDSLSDAIHLVNRNRKSFALNAYDKFIQCYTDEVMSSRYMALYFNLSGRCSNFVK